MMELKIASRSLTDEAGKLRRLHYFLLVDELEAGSFFCEQYGVKIAEGGRRLRADPGHHHQRGAHRRTDDHTGGAAGQPYGAGGCGAGLAVTETQVSISHASLSEKRCYFFFPLWSMRCISATSRAMAPQDHKDAQHSLPHHFQSMRNIFHVRMSSFLLHHRMGLLAKY